ncbi:sulfite exporter TauE/SafE family protein [Psychromonas ossibalaenae]|uniref:sulfite exporter TauE/SafE family protein n=1 Tax=Psychromonas ossibalaenae TaxID=444922 RepID=UPI000371CADD|nr:sulfite exporter TauE/SafE family protein [Psychromonas ossibalaenae]
MLLLAGYILLGAAAGLTAGIFGLGGGIIIVPALIFTFSYLNFPPDVLTHLAVGTSLSTILFTSLSAIYVHHQRLAIDWPLAAKLSAGMLFGGLIGAYFAEFMSGALLQRIFAFYAVSVALQMWFSWSPKGVLKLPLQLGCAALGTVIGIISGLFGIAGGSLVVPVLTLYRVQITRAIATSAVTGFPIALSGSIGYLLMGLNNPDLPENSLGYIYWPATLGIIISSTVFAKFGAKLAHRLPPDKLKKLFSLVLLAVAAKLFL